LAAFLVGQPPRTMTVTLTLAEIEQVIGWPLPAAASTQTWWWGKQDRRRPQPRPWVTAGWQVVRVAMRTVPPAVTFARMALDSTGEPFAPPCPPAEDA
jgi:hypothetical protein